jgi:putative tryptophan/tyrosine transport system substrate-binding protein
VPIPSYRRRILSAAALAAAVLAAAVLAGCSGSDDDSGSVQDIPRVGLMHVGTDHIPPSLGALVTQLGTEYGWKVPDREVEDCIGNLRRSCDLKGKNIELLWRNLEPDAADVQAAVFVLQHVDVIVAFEDKSISAAQKATAGAANPIPIVFLHPSDPVRDGLVTSLAHPDSNLTGVFGARDAVAKQLELYQKLVPGLRRVLTLVDPTDKRTKDQLAEYRAAATQLSRPLVLDVREATTAQDLKRIFRSLRPGEVDGAFLLSSSLRLNHSALTIKLARRARLPVQAHRKEWVQQGALFSYGIDLPLIGRVGARYVDSLLRGMTPQDLPVEEVPKIEFAINLATARRLGIKIPQDLIIQADEVYRTVPRS